MKNVNEMFCISYDRAIPLIYTLEKLLDVGITKCNRMFSATMLTKQWKQVSMEKTTQVMRHFYETQKQNWALYC